VFIPDRERVILFDVATRGGALLPLDDLKAMRDVGVGTALASGLDWNKFEPRLEKYDFDYIRALIQRYEAAGMRVLLPIWERVHTGFPLAWYSQTAQGSIPSWALGPEYLLSPWNAEAQAYAQSVMRLVSDMFTSSRAQVISSVCRHGESVMPQDARYYDPAARASWKAAGLPGATPDQNLPGAAEWIRQAYVKMIAAQQAILAPHHGEAWFMFHLPKRGRVNCGVDWFEDYIAALPDGVRVNHITFTYFANYPGLPEAIQHLRQIGNREWVGAEYCEGLRDGNGELARALGMRGVIVAPCHPFTRHDRLSPWMLDELRKAAR
jgi:hypothetical protein